MKNLKYFIGENYHYPNCTKQFKLSETNGFVYLFECGHRVTDCVFEDLIRTKTGLQVYQDLQMEISL